jgi:DNA-binding NarL/FixJ family response regulator
MTVVARQVLLVDDHELFTCSLELTLSGAGLAAATAPLWSKDALLETVHRTRPDVVLLDLDLGEPLGDGTALVAPITEAGSRVLVVSGTRQLHRFGAALEQGAAEYARKGESVSSLVARIRQLADGLPNPGQARHSRARHALTVHRQQLRERFGPLESLTPREQAVLLALTKGLTAAQVASTEWVSECTVRSQIRGILRKLGVASQVQAVAMALRTGWAIEAEAS